MSIVRHRITPTASPTELANQINRALAAIAKQFDAISAPSATTTVPAAASPFDTVAAPPATGGGTGIPPPTTTQLAGDVTGDLGSNIVGGIQTIPILKPTVDGTVATFVLAVPDIEWKVSPASNIFDSQTTLNGTTAGTLTWAEIFRFTSYKKFIAFANGYENTTGVAQTVTFPVAYTQTPQFTLNITPAATVSTTTLTLPINMVGTTSGLIIVEGY